MAKTKHHQFVDTIDEVLTDAVKKGIFQLYTTNQESENFNGRIIDVNNKQLINFGLCSYLGLEIDQRLKNGVIDAVLKNGTQFAASRAYISNGLYSEFESLLNQIFKANVVISPSTTLGHFSAIPICIEDNDIVILDQQVHSSVQTASQLLRPRGIRIEMIRHNNLSQLEEMLKNLGQKYSRVWYMIDGVYSMYGDFAPLKQLEQLQKKYPELYLYIDDAHGMSWAGENGAGYALSQIKLNERIILVSSLCKAFGCGGGVIVCHDYEIARKIRTCGSTLVFSGPIQNPMLGAGIASAKIHLSQEINELQRELRERISYTNTIIKEYNLPLILESESPIFFVGMGMPKIGYNMVKKLMDAGFYVNIGIFPGVPVKCTGLRITITLHQTKEDILQLIKAIAHYLPIVLEEEGSSLKDIYKAFNIKIEESYDFSQLINSNCQFSIVKEKSISRINKNEWNSLLKDKASFDWDGLNFLEKVFSNNKEPEYNWDFNYIIIKDSNNNIPILATFFTTSLWKEDMLAQESVSKKIEEKRLEDPYYLTSTTISLGTFTTEGQHLYINKNDPNWKRALSFLIKLIEEEQEKVNASSIILRDFDSNDEEMKKYLGDIGFVKVDMPESCIIENNKWDNYDEYLSKLSERSKRHIKYDIFKNEHFFNINVIHNPNEDQLSYFYKLYNNVRERNFGVNTFKYPYKFFKEMCSDPNWEFVEIKLKEEFQKELPKLPIGVIFGYKGENFYCPLLVGINYNYLQTYKVYKQALFQMVKRGKDLGKERLYLGFTASLEKKKFGAKIIPKVAYIQAKDNFNMELIGLISAERK